MSAATAGKTSNGEAAEARTNWKRLGSLTDKQIRTVIRRDADVHPTDEAFCAKAELVMPRSKSDGSIEEFLETVEAQLGLQRM